MTSPESDRPRILIVDDDQQLVMLLEAILRRLEVEITTAATGRRALQALLDAPPDLVLLDMRLPDLDGLEVLEYIRSTGASCTVVVMTADASVELAVEAMRRGALDYLTKPLDGERLRSVVRGALQRHAFLRALERDDEETGLHRFRGLLGGSPAMTRLYRVLGQCARAEAPLLVHGEEGTELEAAARAVVAESAEAGGPIAVLDAGTLEAARHREALVGGPKGLGGAVALAQGGWLLVLDIGRLERSAQEELAHLLETGEVRGAPPRGRAQMRFAATGVTGRGEPAEALGLVPALRARLGVTPVHVPPLRDRGEDILALALYHLRLFGSESGRAVTSLSGEAQARLLGHDWPGNVAELVARMRAAAEAHVSGIVGVRSFEDLPAREDGARRGRALAVDHLARRAIEPLWKTEQAAIERALAATEGNVIAAARLLEISPASLYRRLRRIEGMQR